jgi:hypothetical protein
MTQIKSKIINNAPVNELDTRRMGKDIGYPNAEIRPVLMKVRFNNKTFYCCMAGGKVDAYGSDASLTVIGKFTLQALIELPVKQTPIVLQEIKIGTVSLKQKVIRVFRQYPSGTKICFIGDIAGELDGILIKIFNIDGVTQL